MEDRGADVCKLIIDFTRDPAYTKVSCVGKGFLAEEMNVGTGVPRP
eukprot:CAMPEP_0180142002 /NCGR_PEP_ID=MMETSP0986-20121125/15304_1 /TAXON_ID=697907 /ORGANISM="non described non described, Strain CCMP2293" /LENGTH=45 /DNA_ID= /DNA_START= /DNA_END= /DNA_ORIENTATION=